MPVDITATAVGNLEVGFSKALSDVNPMALSTDVLNDKYKTELSDIVQPFQKICEQFKGKKISGDTQLSDFESQGNTLDDADYITKTVKPFITTIKNKFGFDGEKTLTSVCEHIINVLTGMTEVFDLNLKTTISNIQKAYKIMTGKTAPTSTLNVNYVSKGVKSFLKAQTLIKKAFEDHTWGSSDLQKDGDFKDKKYIELKASLGNLNKKYQELKTEGDIAYKKSAEEIVKLYQQIKTFDHLKLDTNVTKKELDKKVQNFKNIQDGIQCDPYESIKKFLKEVRNLEKGKHKNNAGLVTITKNDAQRRMGLLKEKHWKTIQKTFFEELIDLNHNDFKKTLDLINKCLLRSQRLEAQLKSSTEVDYTAINRKLFNSIVNTYFENTRNALPNINAKSQINITFDQLQSNIATKIPDWDSSNNVVYCIGYIYIQLSSFVEFLNTNIQTATNMLKEANGTLDKKDASKLKFGMDIYGKFATVAAFTGPLVNVSPIFAAIWGAVALSGTIVQIVQVVYNRHQAKKTAEATALEPKKSEKSAEPANKHHENSEEPYDSGKVPEEVDTATTNTDVTKLKKKISDLKILNAGLEVRNKNLESKKEQYKQKVKALETELANLKSENSRLTRNAVDVR